MDLQTFSQDRLRLSQYLSIRKASYNVTPALLELLPKPALSKYAKKLGLLKGKIFVLGHEDEMAILMDYCLFTFARRGKTLIEEILESLPSDRASDEMTLLKAMHRSHYSILQVREIQRGVAMRMFDILRNTDLFLMDVGLSETAQVGAAFAGRVMPIDDYYITSGAFIPLNRELFQRHVIPIVEPILLRHLGESGIHLSRAEEATFSANIIRAALKEDAMDTMLYADPAQ